MGFANQVINFGPIFHRKDVATSTGFQIDLAYMRKDHVITICEIKHLNTKIGTTVIREFNAKLKDLSFPNKYTIQKALITVNGADRSLIESDYFDHIITLDDFL